MTHNNFTQRITPYYARLLEQADQGVTVSDQTTHEGSNAELVLQANGGGTMLYECADFYITIRRVKDHIVVGVATEPHEDQPAYFTHYRNIWVRIEDAD